MACVLALVACFALPSVAARGAEKDASSATESGAAKKSRDVEKAQRTRLRWRAYRPAPQPADEKAGGNAASPGTVPRAEEHARREAHYVVQASATKPKDDPFADPFFDDQQAKAKVKVEPIADDSAPPVQDDAAALESEPQITAPAQQPSEEEQSRTAEQAEPAPPGAQPDEFAQVTQGELPPCPSPADVKRIREITTDISAQAGEFPPECALGNVAYVPRVFTPTMYTWKASALCYKPLYFQQASLERYGHTWGPILQPFISGAQFYLTVPILPYLMGVDPPCECKYALGYYRPGSCAPKMICPVPISLRGGLLEAGIILGGVALVP